MAREDIDTGTLRQRRNVIGLSLILIVYSVADGTLHNRMSTPFGFVNFEHPEYLLGAAYIGLLYSLWRFWMYSQPQSRSSDVSEAHPQMQKGKNSWEKSGFPFEDNTFSFEFQISLSRITMYTDFVRDLYDEMKLDLHDVIDAEGVMVKFPIVRKLPFKRVVYWRYYVDLVGNSNQIANEPLTETDISWLRFAPIETIAQIKTCLFERTFSDTWIPYLLSSAAFVFGLVDLAVGG